MARKALLVLHRPGVAETVSGNSREFMEYASYWGAIWYLNVTVVSGTTPTLDVYITEKDPSSNLFLNQAAALFKFAQQVGVTANPLRQPPGYAATAPAVGDTKTLAFQGFGTILRGEWVIGGGTPSFTFGLVSSVSTEEGGP